MSIVALHAPGLIRRYMATLLIAMLPGTSIARGQTAPPSPPQTPAPPKAEPMAPLPMVQSLKILVLTGEQEMNDLERRVMATLVVEIRDQNDRPVEGADVTFRFPASGPGATFRDEKVTNTVRTNVQGQAQATGWSANSLVGPFTVNVTATYGNQMGQGTVHMLNVTRVTDDMTKDRKRKRAWWASRKWQFLMAAGAGAAITGIVLAARGSGSAAATPPTITISPGTITIGGR